MCAHTNKLDKPHWTFDCPEVKRFEQAQGLCANCFARGHLSIECPSNKSNSKKPSAAQSTSSAGQQQATIIARQLVCALKDDEDFMKMIHANPPIMQLFYLSMAVLGVMVDVPTSSKRNRDD
jgi:hypothetical protein